MVLDTCFYSTYPICVSFYQGNQCCWMVADSTGSWFGKIDEKTKTPKNAILFVMVISLFAPWFGREVLSWIVDMSSIGAAIGYFYTCLATYRTLKDNSQDKKPGLMICSILGAIFSLCFVGLLIIPGMPSYLVPQARICLLVWIVLGVIFYFWSKRSLS